MNNLILWLPLKATTAPQQTGYLTKFLATIKLIAKWSILYGLALLFIACKRAPDTRDLEDFIAQVKNLKSPVEALPDLSLPAQVHLVLKQPANPFSPRLKRLTLSPRHIPEPLEAYSLASLKMAGTLSQDNRIWGIITTPDQHSYAVQVGHYIGQNFGKIIAINAHEIRIVESIPQQQTWRQRQTALVLK